MLLVVLLLAFCIGVWINYNNLRMCEEFGFDSTDSSRFRPIIMGSISSALILILYLFEYTDGEFLRFILLSTFTLFLLRASAIDHDTLLVPDRITFPLFIIGIVASMFSSELPLIQIWEGLTLRPVVASIFGAISGFGSACVFRAITRLVAKEETLGFGDVLFFGALGAWLGWQLLVVIVVIFPFVGLLYALFFRQDKQFALVPSLAVGAYCSLLFRENFYSYLVPILNVLEPRGVIMIFFAFLYMASTILFLILKVKNVFWPDIEINAETPKMSFPSIHSGHAEIASFPGAVNSWPGVSSGRGTLYNRIWSGR